ncbi:MAG: beta-N-acetylhexosaminidase, partial [Candidatus Omnitrophica bacterium]|nr:beta-N-acetylhexosaminidase [Candidatus Omnitrophota bacterium]
AGRTSLVEDDIKHKSYFVNCLSGQGMKVEYYSFLEKGNKLPSLEGNNQVIVCTYDAVHNPQQAKMVKKLQAKGEPLIVLAIRNPYDLNLFPEISTYLTTYDYSPTNLQVASEIITGKYEARGVLPITLKALEQ